MENETLQALLKAIKENTIVLKMILKRLIKVEANTHTHLCYDATEVYSKTEEDKDRYLDSVQSLANEYFDEELGSAEYSMNSFKECC